MSDSVYYAYTNGLIVLNDALRQAFERTGSRAFLIKDGRAVGKRWEVVRELTGGWLLEFSEFRGQFKLLWATLDASAEDDLAQSSYLAYGVPNSDGEVEVFFRHPERCDIIAPNVSNAQWKVYYEKQPAERFIVS